jgi:uncharacterized metal-binding protein YceD (DUF177 family)
VSQEHYKIPFAGLKPGVHEFNFEVTETFFESYEYSEIEKADCHIKLTMEKQSTMLLLTFEVAGTVELPCDRCSEVLDITLNGEYGMIAKFSDVETQNTEEIIYLPISEYQIDVREFIYEFIQLSVPIRKVHKEGECDEEMIESLEEYLISENSNEQDSSNITEGDPRWEALKKLTKEK